MSLPSMELAPIVPAISRLQRGASRISANFYGKTGPFGLISAGFWPFWLQLARDGVLIWRASRNARHVFRRTATFHAINRPFIPGVRITCNAPTCGYLDWRFTDFIATAIWRTSCYRKKSQRSVMHSGFPCGGPFHPCVPWSPVINRLRDMTSSAP